MHVKHHRKTDMSVATCIISSLEKNATSFNPFLHAYLSEIYNLRDEVSNEE